MILRGHVKEGFRMLKVLEKNLRFGLVFGWLPVQAGGLCVQGVCEGAGAGGEQAGLHQAAATAAAREGAQRLCRLDLQSR